MIVTQYSKGPSEFIQQVARIDPCACDTLTSVAGGYQCGSSHRPGFSSERRALVNSADSTCLCYHFATQLDGTRRNRLVRRRGCERVLAGKHSLNGTREN